MEKEHFSLTLKQNERFVEATALKIYIYFTSVLNLNFGNFLLQIDRLFVKYLRPIL